MSMQGDQRNSAQMLGMTRSARMGRRARAAASKSVLAVEGAKHCPKSGNRLREEMVRASISNPYPLNKDCGSEPRSLDCPEAAVSNDCATKPLNAKALTQITYHHPLGDIVVATTTRELRDEFGLMVSITLPRISLLENAQ